MSSVQGSRRRSSSQASSSRRNHKFVTRWKQRSGDKSLIQHTNQLSNHDSVLREVSVPERKSRSFIYPNSCTTNEDFSKTSGQLKGANFSHHHPELCVCEKCLCGRHLCQMHNVKPDLSKNSIYRVDFLKKKPIQNKINISQAYDRLKGPHLEMNSIYLKDYPDRDPGKVEKPIPEDLLKTGGPCPNLTSYSSGFPGYKGSNQYVKPTDKYVRGNFPVRDKSTYTRAFLGEKPKIQDYKPYPDNLKTGTNWFGSSHYSDKFRQPNPEDYPAQQHIIQKKEDNPDYCRQYQTVYRKSFLGDQGAVCPAKVVLQTKSKGFFSQTKNRFSENTDYKALSPDYHAISTSKHCYV